MFSGLNANQSTVYLFVEQFAGVLTRQKLHSFVMKAGMTNQVI